MDFVDKIVAYRKRKRTMNARDRKYRSRTKLHAQAELNDKEAIRKIADIKKKNSLRNMSYRKLKKKKNIS